MSDTPLPDWTPTDRIGDPRCGSCPTTHAPACGALDWAEQLLGLCGQRLLIAAVAETASPPGPRRSIDDLTSDQLDRLYERADTYRDAWKSSRARWWKANAHIDELDTRVRELEAEIARLTAGQCTHTLAMCLQHHAVPVADCPYPRCVTARSATA